MNELRKHNYEVYSIREHAAGASDKEVISITLSKEGILITEDFVVISRNKIRIREI